MSSPFGQSSILRRIREILGIEAPMSGQVRRTSRRDREQQNHRMLVAGLSIVAVLTVISLVGGLMYENIVKPNAVLAEVGDEEITRREYWKYHSVQLYQQANEYESFASQVEGQQRTQFLSFAASFRAQADDVWGTTDVSETTLTQMVEDQLYLKTAEEMDLDLSEQAVESFALQQFAPEGAELVTPYPEPTLIPERAAWATGTAEAAATQQAEIEAQMGTPAAATPGVNGTPTAGGTPVAGATPIDRQEAAAEATDGFAQFQEQVFGDAHISLSDYYRLVARPELARQLVTSAIGSEVPQSAEQVKASHILVSTEDLARELYERATSGADFSELARSNSIDQMTAATGGDLGWFTFDQMVEPFAEAAFSLEEGTISEPVQTQFGWHLIKVEESDDERPLTDLQYQQAQQRAVQARLEEVRETTDIDSDSNVIPTPSPTPAQFSPPADAPTPVPATPIPATPGATPVAGATPVVEGPVLAPETPEPEN